MTLLLAQKKVDVNQLTPRGTALHLAVANEDRVCLEMLLRHEADIDLLNNEGKNPLQICKNEEIKKIIEKRAEIKRLPQPSISKGFVSKVTSMTYRLK